MFRSILLIVSFLPIFSVLSAQSDTLYTQFFKYWEAYDWRNAISTGETLKNTAKVGNAPRDSFDYGYFSSKLGRAYVLVGDFEKATLNYEDAFQYISPDSMHYGVMYTELAQLNMMRGRLIDGEAQAEKAVEWYQQHGFTHSDKYPNAIRILGDLLYMQGQSVLAERQFQTALQLWLSNDFPPSKILGTIYDDLGLCYDQQDRPLQAEYYYLKADTLFRQFMKPNDPIRYAVKKQLAELYISKGAWGTARRLIQELGEQASAQFGVHSDRYAQYLQIKAQLFEAIGEGNNNRDAVEAQCAIYQNLYGGRHHQTINAQINLGLILVNLHEEALAKGIALRALDSIDASGEMYLNLKIRVYSLLSSCSDHDITWRKKALAVESETGSPGAETVAMLAVDYLWHNLPDSAAQVLTILDTLEQYVPEGASVMRRIHSARGQVAAERNDYGTALSHWSKMIANAERKFIDNMFTGNEVQRMEHYNEILWFNNLLLIYARTEAAKKAGIAGLALNFDIFTKSLLLGVAQKIRESALDGHDPVLKNAFENWVKAREQLAWCYTQSAKELNRQKINLPQLEQAADSLERMVAMHNAEFAAENFRQPFTWQHVTANLASGEAAIQIKRFAYARKEAGDPVRYAFYILRPGIHDYPEMVFVEDGDRLEDLLTESYLSACANADGKGNTNEWYQAVWAKLEPYLKGVSRIYLSADGIFHKINMEAIRLPNGEYVADHFQILPVFSLKDIRSLLAREDPEYVEKSALLIGNPSFLQAPGDNHNMLTLSPVSETPNRITDSDNSARALSDWRGLRLTPLPGSEKEVITIADLMRGQKWEVTVLTGNDATAAKVKAVKNATVVHLATHGYFLANDRSGTAGLSKKALTDNPMLRSMLFFAGAQNTLDLAPLPNDDGILTAYEVQNMHLEKTQLVVLSACQTAQGKIQNGEGVFGLQRALRIAGARHVLLSLWDIDDKVGQEFMQIFYQNWLDRKSKTDAFRAAQTSIRKKYPQPFYWAGFVLIGG